MMPSNGTDDLMRNVAEDVKTPLVRILSQIQLSKVTGTLNDDLIEATADAALRLLDSYIVSTQIYNGQQQLTLEPVSVGALMQDSARYLARLARQHNCDFSIEVRRGVGLVMANPLALQAALTSLGYSFLYALQEPKKKHRISYVARVTKEGIQAGVFSKDVMFFADSLHKIRNLQGRARQLAPDLAHGSATGIAIADSLFKSMHTDLKAARYSSARGLSVTLLPSQQLALL